MTNVSRYLLFSFLSLNILVGQNSAFAQTPIDDGVCQSGLIQAIEDFEAQDEDEPGKATSRVFIEQIIANDRPTFAELIDPNPEKNLFARAPLTGMSGAQRMLALVQSKGVERRRIGFLPEPIEVYPFLTDGLPETQGYRLEGNWKAANEIVSFMRAQAEGDRSGRTVPVAIGPGGTGKSESRTVIEKGAEYMTLHNPDYFVYTFDWVNLNQLHEMVKRWGPDVDVIPAPRHMSPIIILPPKLQQQALRMAAIKGEKMLDGIEPNVNLRPDKWSKTILGYIIEQYTAQKGQPLTMAETLQAIAKHVRVRRTVMSSSYNQFPVINVQGIEADHSQLFVSSNPVVQAISPEGKMDAFAYSFSGLVFHGELNMTVFEEALRSHPNFMEKLMDGLESRELQFGGAGKEPWDSFVLFISNLESYNILMSKPGLKAFKQRLQKVDMAQPSQPQLIARTILYGFKDNLYMQPLGDNDAPWEKGDLDKLFPIPETLEPGKVIGPEGRYRMRIGKGKKAVEISPHTLRFMAQIIATTRFETDQERAYSLVPSRLVHGNLFTDVIQRVRFWEGMLTDIQPEERRTLDEMTNKLEEGHNGIVHRNALGWMRKALSLVRSNPRYGMTLTPSALFKVFEDEGFRTDGFIETSGPAQEHLYKTRARLVLKELLIPTVLADINRAYSGGMGSIQSQYQDLLDELMAEKNPNAKEYTSSATGRIQSIDKDRTKFVKAHYKKRTGRDIPMDLIMHFHMNQLKNGERKIEPSPELVDALSEYMAQETLRAVKASGGLGEALRSRNPSEETIKLKNSLITQMEKLGYNLTAALDAFDLEDLAKQAQETVEPEKP